APPALQLPAEVHDIEESLDRPPWLSAVMPGTSLALAQVPLLSVRMYAWTGASTAYPTALQLPDEGHDSDVMVASSVPGALLPAPQVPFAWLSTNASMQQSCPPWLGAW